MCKDLTWSLTNQQGVNLPVLVLVPLPDCSDLLNKVEELRRDLRIKSQELEAKNAAANDKLKKMVKDQQEAEKKKVGRKKCFS